MKVLVVGHGGREHALAWKMTNSPRVEHVYVAPGNAGTALENNVTNVDIAVTDIEGLKHFAQQNNITLTVIGPEIPLVNGIVDAFSSSGLRCFGPSQAAAQLEGSKSFAKDFLSRHQIPTADYASFTEMAPAKAYVHEKGIPIVIKADGLAAGKGVIIAQNETEAMRAIDDMLAGNRFGEAGHCVVIEEFLQGEEASFIVMTDGKHILPFATSQDHKARDNGDQGPNTGGMGAYSPAPIVTPELHAQIMSEVIEPTVQGMAADGHTYIGFLYAGLMIAQDNTFKVLEFNCRFGDPETQPIMMRLQSDLAQLCHAALDGQLDQMSIQWDQRAALGVVLTAGGYPNPYEQGHIINGLTTDQPEDQKIFHAGTAQQDDQIVTSGGRVLCATALGKTVSQAQHKAYALAEQIQWSGIYYRTDIGHKAIERENAETSRR